MHLSTEFQNENQNENQIYDLIWKYSRDKSTIIYGVFITHLSIICRQICRQKISVRMHVPERHQLTWPDISRTLRPTSAEWTYSQVHMETYTKTDNILGPRK